ncbi:MAG TPA: proline dehydrogenase family protein, partial [Nitrosopumilaceae archaeon]|nr:proline dehydrogenase family protein [Nitrosopumilaceae archaeon]
MFVCYIKNKRTILPNNLSMLSFDNTENAFKGKSDKDLKRSYLLFKLMSYPALVKIGAPFAPLALHIGFKGLVKNTIFRQFVGGENIQDCSRTIEELGKYNIGTILDYSVEGKESEADFDACCKETIETIHRAKSDRHIPFCVFKVTGLGRHAILEKVSAGTVLGEHEAEEWEKVKQRVTEICKIACEAEKPIFIDAEECATQPAIDALADENMALFNRKKAIIYNTYQLYRKDRLDFLKASYQKAQQQGYYLGAKLVRGAYMEKERKRALEKSYDSPIHDNKKEADKDYDAALEFCVSHIEGIGLCAGTHNEKSSLFLAEQI